MADTNLYKILSGLYTGLNKLNIKSDRRDDEIITGYLGYDVANAPETSGTVKARLEALENFTGVAPSALTILDKTYNTKADVTITADDIIANVSGVLATDSTKLALAKDVKAVEDGLDTRLDVIEASYLTGVAISNTANNALTLTKNGHDVDGTVLVDGDTIVLSGADNRITANLGLKKVATVEGYAASYQLQTSGGTVLGETINIFKDQFLSGAAYDASKEAIVLDFIVADPAGTDKAEKIEIPVSGLVHEFEGVSGVAIDFNANGTTSQIKGVVDPASENFLTVGAAGFKLSGVQDAINAAKGEEATKLTELSGKVSGAFGSDNAVVTAADGGITKSTYTIGGATLAADPTNKLATEAAVAAADAALKAELSGAISGAYDLDEIVLGAGTGLKASDYRLGADTDEYTDTAPAANKVMTEASFYKYVHTELSGLADAVDSLVI